MPSKFKYGAILYLLGFLGVLSMLTVEIALPPEVADRFSPAVLKLLIVTGPAIYLLIAVIIGVALGNKVGLTAPLVAAMAEKRKPEISFGQQLKAGVAGGVLAGVLLAGLGALFQPMIPESFAALADKIKLTVLARLLYGGFTEELIMRFGLMTLFVWLAFKVSKRLNAATYWAGIWVATLLFAVGHFPVVYSVVAEPTAALLLYVLLGNSVAGVFFGWLYWKKGLEAAFIAHAFCHIMMLVGEQLLHLK